MRRWFLSYNAQDLKLGAALEAAVRDQDPRVHVYFAPRSLRAGGFWVPQLADEIARATAFVLVVGAKGVGPWQVLEYYEALDRRVKEADFPVVLVLLEGASAPGLPFVRQLNWVVATQVWSEDTVARLINATDGGVTPSYQRWRNTTPYRGLAAMTEADSEFFFGRRQETVEVISALATNRHKVPVLLGNSGVGKSSLAQAGVLAALKRQAWPEAIGYTKEWPTAFQNSRQWCFLTLRPGTEPIRALVDSFLRTWQHDPTDAAWEERRLGWIDRLIAGNATLPGLLDAADRRHEELGHRKPPAFFLYIDHMCTPRSARGAVSPRFLHTASAIRACGP
jgi:hypothetical protein